MFRSKTKNKEKKRIFFKGKSITMIMFWLSFGTITFVLIMGFLIIGVITPRVYGNSIMKEIENNLIATIEYYDISLKDIDLDSVIEIETEDFSVFKNGVIFRLTDPSFFENMLDDDAGKVIQTINIRYLLDSLGMSRSAIIEITDMDNNLIYQTPHWYQENVREVRFHNKASEFLGRRWFLQDLIEDNTWISRSTVLSLDEDYLLKVRVDLRALNQNIMIFNRIFIYMLIVGGLFAIIFSIILSFIVTKPLKELKKIASSMENMDFSVRYDKNRSDEIGQLGKTLNHMMDRLGTTINKLQAELQKEKRTDKLRREFVAQVSHELKTPVSIVSNYTEALLDGVADTKEEQDSYLNTIENECHKMAHIINDLLDLSQMEAGTFKIYKSRFEFKDLIEDLIGKYENLTKGKFEFITDIKMESAMIYGDELRIEQAVSNLLSNAIKHTEKNGYIKLSGSKENNMVHIQVENQGKPIDQELLLHIWDSFTKGADEKGADEKGAGLGLSITKNIVELHEGEYYVQNLDNSVVFGIRLPIE